MNIMIIFAEVKYHIMGPKSFKDKLIKLSIKVLKRDIEADFYYKGTPEERTYAGDLLSVKKGQEIRYHKFDPVEWLPYYELDFEYCFNLTDHPMESFKEKTFKKSKWYFIDPWIFVPEKQVNQIYQKDIKDKDIEKILDKKRIDYITKLFSE